MKQIDFFKIGIFFCLFLGFQSTLLGQVKTGHKALKKGNYTEAIKAFENDLLNLKSDLAVEAEHLLSKIYMDNKYKDRNLEKAYEYAKNALTRYERLDSKEKEKLQKRGIGFLTIKNYKQQVVEEAYRDAVSKKTYKAYQHFLDYFESENPMHKDHMSKLRNEKGFSDLQKSNSYSAYRQFYKDYFESCQLLSPHIAVQLQKQLFESYIQENSWNAYNQFASLYPQNIYVKDSIAALHFLPIATSNKMDDFKRFLVGYPKSPFAKLAIDAIARLTIASNNIEDFDYFVRSFSNEPQVNEVWLPYFKRFLELKGAQAEEEFKQMYPQAPINKLIKMTK